jgi:cob(I)alamin adenosyltransferase
MDKKAKKRLEVLRHKLQKLQQQLAGAKQQEDEPGEVRRLEQEIASVEAELERIKQAG